MDFSLDDLEANHKLLRELNPRELFALSQRVAALAGALADRAAEVSRSLILQPVVKH
ncbi:hypothetical protein IMX07_00890 [bacterium]|nr:hypothetical protein [bacterium]